MKTYLTYSETKNLTLEEINLLPHELDLPFVPEKNSILQLSETHPDTFGTYDTFKSFKVTKITYDYNITTQEAFAALTLKFIN